MAVDVVVVNYHTYDLLMDFAKSYADAWFPGCTLTVVDVETQGMPAGLWDYGMTTWIFTPTNVGYGRACNDGAKQGTNDVILLANADTVLSGGLKECHDALMDNNDWGVLGPLQVNAADQITAGGTFGTPSQMYHRGWRQVDVGQCDDVRDDAMTVSGSLYFIKRHLWDELTHCAQGPPDNHGGAFLETPHYYDETWCSFHARAHGYKCVYYGAVKMVHYWHASTPVGGEAEQHWNTSLSMYRTACEHHGIECE